MKNPLLLLALGVIVGAIGAQIPAASATSATMPANPTPPAATAALRAPDGKLLSHVYDWTQMTPTTMANGVRRAVFEGPTTTLDKLHCHITTLNPGERSGQPSLHPQEEVIIIHEGTIEATYDGKAVTAGPGSVIFFAAGATTALHNPGKTPATYVVINYYPPKAAASPAPAK